MTNRIIILVDMDCFYVQVEERDHPHIKGNPAAVVQYNTWKGGGIIAVNYEARSFGVKRGMRGDEAKEKCPNIYLIKVPTQRGKADLTKYRNAGKEVISVLCEFSDCVERASIDEAYIDMTRVVDEKALFRDQNVTCADLPSTWVIGYDGASEDTTVATVREEGLNHWLEAIDPEDEEEEHTFRLALTARICEEMRRRVLEVTGFKCSAGISHNKVLGKLACGLHKPNQQSILPLKSVPKLWSKFPIGKVRNLGGKLGDSLVTDFGCQTMGDLSALSLNRLKAKYDEKTACWLHGLGRGIDSEAVVPRQLPKSVGCGKNFMGKEALNSSEKIRSWIKALAEELSERLDEDEKTNDRLAKTLTVHVRTDVEPKGATTRSCPLTSSKADAIARIAWSLIAAVNAAANDQDDKWFPPVKNLSLSASKFEPLQAEGTKKIDAIFKKVEGDGFRINKTGVNKERRECMSESSFVSNHESFTTDFTSKTLQKSRANDKNRESFLLQYLARKPSRNMKETSSHSVADVQDVDEFEKKERINTVVGTSPVTYSCNESVASNFISPTQQKSSTDNENKDSFSLQHLTHKRLQNAEASCSNLVANNGINEFEIKKKINTKDDDSLNSDDHDSIYDHSTDVEDDGSDLKKIGNDSSSPVLKSKSHYGECSAKYLSQIKVASNRPGLEAPTTSTSEVDLIPSKDNSDFVSVDELFPDLNNVDPSIVLMLPKDLQRRVEQLVRSRQSGPCDQPSLINIQESDISQEIKDDDGEINCSTSHSARNQTKFKQCQSCKREILSTKFLEHQDYHFALELRRQQLDESKMLIVSENKRKSTDRDRPRKKLKKNALSACKIYNYFNVKEKNR